MVEYEGKKYANIVELAKAYGAPVERTRYRYQNGIPVDAPTVPRAYSYRKRSQDNPLRKWQPNYLSKSGLTNDQRIGMIKRIAEEKRNG